MLYYRSTGGRSRSHKWDGLISILAVPLSAPFCLGRVNWAEVAYEIGQLVANLVSNHQVHTVQFQKSSQNENCKKDNIVSNS